MILKNTIIDGYFNIQNVIASFLKLMSIGDTGTGQKNGNFHNFVEFLGTPSKFWFWAELWSTVPILNTSHMDLLYIRCSIYDSGDMISCNETLLCWFHKVYTINRSFPRCHICDFLSILLCGFLLFIIIISFAFMAPYHFISSNGTLKVVLHHMIT